MIFMSPGYKPTGSLRIFSCHWGENRRIHCQGRENWQKCPQSPPKAGNCQKNLLILIPCNEPALPSVWIIFLCLFGSFILKITFAEN